MSGNTISSLLTLPVTLPRQAAEQAVRATRQVLQPVASYALETAYHPMQAAFTPPPQGGSNGPSGVTGPYALPPGQTLAEVAGGTRAQPFDVTLSQLATAVYGTRGDPPEGWSAVTDDMLRERGVENPTAWRQEFLGDGKVTSAQQFKAEVYTDGDGNFVLSYRGTAEGAADWGNNFRQAAGFETHGFADKFSDTAVNTAKEFAEVFGNDNNDNLAVTGHSQGGGLASVGALAAGIPGVTFDASGIHPNTLERMGFSPEAARAYTNNGGVRAYSLDSDLLSQVQESGPLGLIAPDALGTRIIVSPGPVAEHTVSGRAAGVEMGSLSPRQQAALNVLVEGARHSGIPLISQAGQLVYSAFSHNPNVLTAAMIEREPWQEGYENPSSPGRDLQNLIPDSVKDGYSINAHDLIGDVIDVANTDFANGNYVQGGARLLGDLGEGFFNSVGDTISGFGDQWASDLRDQSAQWGDGLRGQGRDGLAVVVEGFGGATTWALENGSSALEWAADGTGQLFETVADLGGRGAQFAVDGFVSTVKATGSAITSGVNYTVDAVGTGVNYALETASNAWNTTTSAISSGASWLNSKMPWNR